MSIFYAAKLQLIIVCRGGQRGGILQLKKWSFAVFVFKKKSYPIIFPFFLFSIPKNIIIFAR